MIKPKRDYLFQRPGSQNWWIKLQAPSNIERSLGTPDRAQAYILALPMIAEHKAKLLEAQPRFHLAWRHRYEPGQEHVTPEGERIIADDRELIFLDPNGAIVRKERNGKLAFAEPFPSLREQKVIVRREDAARRTVRAANTDDDMIETYLKHKNLAKYFEREARAVWALYKDLTDSKPLKDATRDDGRKLVDHFEKEGLKTASIQKKVGWLIAAVNLAIDEGKLTFNPFSKIVRDRDDKERRFPLSEADIRNLKRNLHTLGKDDQLLFRMLASTGMRLSEAFNIDGELKEKGVRYIIIDCGRPGVRRMSVGRS